jgi:hypothetical protein
MEASIFYNQYKELGFLVINQNEITIIHYPLCEIYNNDRLPAMMSWLKLYIDRQNHDRTIDGHYFFTVFDGFREHTEPSKTGNYKPILESQLTKYGEFQFVNPNQNDGDYPLLPYPIIAFSRHKNDIPVVCIPNYDFIVQKGFTHMLDEVRGIQWESKADCLYWRGGNNGSKYRVYDPSLQFNQRELAVQAGASAGASHIDIKFGQGISKLEFLKHKYLLDVDGMVNAWSGLFWKLMSNSLVMKVASHYEEWYYKCLIPYVHYVPIKGDMSDLVDQYHWAQSHETEVKEMVKNANQLATKISFEYSLKSSKIRRSFIKAKKLLSRK